MTEPEARLTAETLRRLGIPGVAAPSGQHGRWRIYDQHAAPRRDITTEAQAAMRDRLGEHAATPTPPARGFVFPGLARG